MADLKLLKDLRWRLDDIRDMLMKEGFDGQRIYGCDEWSTPTVNLATAIGVIDKALASPPVAVQEEGEAKDGARYREFFASGLPITFLGVEYRTKAELDAAIDAVKGDQP